LLKKYREAVDNLIWAYEGPKNLRGLYPDSLNEKLKILTGDLRRNLNREILLPDRDKKTRAVNETVHDAVLYLKAKLVKIGEGYTLLERMHFRDPLQELGMTPNEYLDFKVHIIQSLFRQETKDLAVSEEGYAQGIESESRKILTRNTDNIKSGLEYQLKEIIAVGKRYDTDISEILKIVGMIGESYFFEFSTE